MLRRKTKVLILKDHLGSGSQIRGIGRLFWLWATHLDAEKYDITLCIFRAKSSLCRSLEERGIKLVCLQKAKYDPITLLHVLRLIRQVKPDIMHLQGYGASTFGRLARAVTGIPVLVHYHEPSTYYPWIQRLSDMLLGRFTDGYLAVSNSARDWWSQRLALNPKGLATLYNCIPLEDFTPLDSRGVEIERRQLGIEPTCNVVGAVTRLFEIKGTRYLLEAAPRVLELFPNTFFLIVGDGPIREELEHLAALLGIRNQVVFTGYVKNVAPYIDAFDVMVLTSYAEGGGPLPILEAMAMAKPIVTTNIVEVIEDGVTGLVIPPKDSSLLAEKITYLLQNKEEAIRLGRNAREASKIYDVRLHAQRLEQIYASLIEERKAALQ